MKAISGAISQSGVAVTSQRLNRYQKMPVR